MSSLHLTSPLAVHAAAAGVSKDAFFRRIAVADPSAQKHILQVVLQELQELIHDGATQALAVYYPTIVRLARDAPFKAIRDAMAGLKEAIRASTMDLGDHHFHAADECHRVSYFVDSSMCEAAADSDDRELVALFQAEYIRTGRVSHFARLLAWHKSYLHLYEQTIVSIMVQDGALPLHWRSYIALMAASELRCHYLADLQQHYSVVNGGDYRWTKGIDYVSPKLFRLHELSSILAHRPWLITPEHIGELLSSDQADSWSVSELVHAIIVLCQYHSMSCVALGVGCAEEQDLSIGDHEGAVHAEKRVIRYLERSQSDESSVSTASTRSSCSSSVDSIEGSVDVASIERDDTRLLTLLKNKRRESYVTSSSSSGESVASGGDDFEFEIVEQEGVYDFSEDCSSRRRDTLWRFCGGSIVQYADFDVRSSEYNVLHTEDFSWEEHGFSLVRRYFPGKAGQILEDQFNLTSKLTYDYYGAQKEEEVDTSPYRNAIWYYVHRIFGICHDDYDYRQVNVYLNRPTKIFIKKVACTPWKVTKDDFEHFDRTLSPSEKCHVTLLVAEARKQAGLMYGLRAVMQHMK